MVFVLFPGGKRCRDRISERVQRVSFPWGKGLECRARCILLPIKDLLFLNLCSYREAPPCAAIVKTELLISSLILPPGHVPLRDPHSTGPSHLKNNSKSILRTSHYYLHSHLPRLFHNPLPLHLPSHTQRNEWLTLVRCYERMWMCVLRNRDTGCCCGWVTAECTYERGGEDRDPVSELQ